ncbi:MAG: thioredoxin domain-containing protein [Pseudomonadota bacterium]
MPISPVSNALKSALAATLLGAALASGGGASALAQTAPVAKPSALSPEMKAAVDAQIRAYLLENPELIVEAMQVLEERRLIAQAEARRAIMTDLETRKFEEELTFVSGAPEGDVTLIEFVDYNCPACKAFSPAVQSFLKSDQNTRYVAILLPFQGAGAEVAARAALASKRMMPPAEHAAYHQALLDYQGRMDESVVMSLAAEAGLDVNALLEAMGSDAVSQTIQDNLALAQSMQVNGTPTYAIGDEVFNFRRGEDPAARLARAAAAARTDGAAN